MAEVGTAESAAVAKAEAAAAKAAKARLAEVTALAKAELAAVAAARAAVEKDGGRLRFQPSPRVQAEDLARAAGAGSHPDVPAHPPKAPGMLAYLRRQAKEAGDLDFDVEIARARSAELRSLREAKPSVGGDTTAMAKPAGGFATADDVAAWVRLAAVRTAALAEARAAEKAEADRKQSAIAKAVAMAAAAKSAKAAAAEAEWLKEAEAEAAAEAVVAEAKAKAEAAVQEEAAKVAEAAKREHAVDLQRRKEARLAGEAAAPYAFPQKSSGMSDFLRRQAQSATDAEPAPGRQRKANERGGRGGAVQP